MRAARLILALAASAVFAQNALWIDLSGTWRMTKETRPEFANPAFDDSQWSSQVLPPAIDPMARPSAQQFWLRRTVILPEGTDRRQLALTLGTFSDDYEVFVNGVRIGATGGTSRENSRIARPLTFTIPPEAAQTPDNRLAVAIHAWNWGLRGSGSLLLEPAGPFLLTYHHQAPPRIGSDYLQLRRARRTPNGIFGALLIGLALLLLLVWTGQRERRDLLWFVAAVLGETSVTLIRYLGIGENSIPARLSAFTTVGGIVYAASLTSFVAATFEYRERWVWALIGALWSVPLIGYVTVGPLFFYRLFTGLAAFLALGLVLWRWETWRQRPVFMLALVLAILERPARNLAGLALSQWTLGSYVVELDAILMVLLASVISYSILQRARTDGLERQRLASELQAGRLAQQLFLSPLALAGGGTWSIAAAYEPAAEVGGDFYQAFPLGDGGTLVAVGDVSGKGLKAAMVVSLVSGALRNRQSDDPAALLGELNRALTGSLDSGFVTAALARLHSDGRVTLASAGHPAPSLMAEEVALEAGLPLGLVPDAEYANREIRLEPGQQLTFVSDGVLEAENAGRELFGFQRTRALSAQPAQEIAEAAKQWGQNDDITVVTVRRVNA